MAKDCVDSGVYYITNTSNGKRYVGSSIHIQRRWKEHLSALRNGRHANRYLQEDFDFYGEDKFDLQIIELADGKEELFKKEQAYLMSEKLYDRARGYNISRDVKGGGLFGSDNPMLGVSPRERMDEETYEKWLQSRPAKSPMEGKRHSAEARKKMSENHMGNRHSEAWKKNHSEILKGRKLTPENCEKIRQAKLSQPTKRDASVVCIETGIVYKSMGAAARAYNVTTTAISQCIRGRSKTCGKMHWELAKKE